MCIYIYIYICVCICIARANTMVKRDTFDGCLYTERYSHVYCEPPGLLLRQIP